jgi:hypothetical protein
VIDASGLLLRLYTEQPSAAGDAVKIKCQDTLVLGEVSYCCRNGCAWALMVAIEHILFNVSQTANQCRRFLHAVGK